jgi:hypothetical protein
VRLRGKNFQSWSEFSLDIEGLTVITGTSDTGKSAIFRALKGVLRNELPSEFVRDGQDEAMEVSVEVGGHNVSARRTHKGSTTYVIDAKDYAKLAKAAPEALKDLKFNDVIIGDFDVDPIFGRQNSPQYKRCHGVQMPKASLRGSEAGVPSFYQPFAGHGISPWVAEAMKRASRQ